MKLYMVSLGPGDYELITVKALKALKNSDAICVPTKSPDHSFTRSMTYKIIQKLMEEFDFDKTLLVSTLSLDESNEAFYKYKEDYIETIDMPFEFISIPVGKKYDHALQKRYGNYMEIVKGGSCHGGVFFDTEKSYCEYVK